jgi:SPP1 gp7 family putative phage head morphogenesis protein
MSLQRAYRAEIDRWLFEALLVADLWAHHYRADAAGFDIPGSLRNLRAEIEDAPARIAPAVDIVAKRVLKGASQFEGRLYDAAGKYLGMGSKQIAGVRLPSLSLRAAPGVAIDTYRQANVDRIKSIGTERLGEMTDLLQEAEDGNWDVRELRKKIQEQFSVSKSKADLLARDQTLKLGAAITKERQTQAGISQYVWSTSGDGRVREGHAELDGTTQSWDDPPDTGEGELNHPGEDYQCRCIAIPIMPSIDTLEDVEE